MKISIYGGGKIGNNKKVKATEEDWKALRYEREEKKKENKIIQLNKPKHSNERVYDDKGLSPSLNTMQGGSRQPFVKAVLTPGRNEKRQHGRRMKEDGEPMFTLTGQDIHGVALEMRADERKGRSTLHSQRVPEIGTKDISIRRLTPVECERLQGFPSIFNCPAIFPSCIITYFVVYGNNNFSPFLLK